MKFGRDMIFRAAAAAFAAVLLSTSVALAVPPPSAIPVPTDAATQQFRKKLEDKQFRLEQLKAQLDQLDNQLSIAVDAYDAANVELTKTQQELSITEMDLANAQSALSAQQSLLDTRVVQMYQTDQYNPAGILLAAKSIPEFFSRLQFVREISIADADLAGQLSAQRNQISGQEVGLKAAEMQAKALEFTLRARKIEIEGRILDRETMLKSAEADVAKMLASEEARRAGIERVLWQNILLGASVSGVQIEPGSPAETVLAYHGIPYVWGGASTSGFDCSGLTMYVMAQHGVKIPHHAADQVLLGTKVQPGDLKAGDLVFFGSPVHHVGMYIGGGYFVHAPRTGDYVKVSKLAERSDLVAVRRYPWTYRIGQPAGVGRVTFPSNLPTGR